MIEHHVQRLLGVRPVRVERLGGGCVADVSRAVLPDGSSVVVKLDPARASGLDAEAAMLRRLAERTRLPVPRVLAGDAEALILEHIPHAGSLTARGEEHAADLLADLHAITADSFGFGEDTRLGGLVQPNGWSRSWPEFFARRRLVHMAERARDAGRITERLASRVRRLADRLDRLLPHDPPPSLIHGDVWAGNVLGDGDRVAAFIDPAISHADAEVELAFIALFHCFGPAFWRRYHERRPIDPAFFDTRRDLYNIYPLLVHARLFGGGYAGQVDDTLTRFGC